MEELYTFLHSRLDGTERLAVLGAGSVLRADDGAGIAVVEQLCDCFRPENYHHVRFYDGGTAPENYSGAIKKYHPTHILVLDAADAGEEPGSITFIDAKDIGGPTFCSHMLPLKVMLDYLETETGASVTLLGIQPKDLTFDSPMTAEVKNAVEELSEVLKIIIKELLAHAER